MKHSRGSTIRTPMQIFRVPLLLAVLSMIGLIAALAGDDVWDVLSWLSLSVPLGVIIRMLQKSA